MKKLLALLFASYTTFQVANAVFAEDKTVKPDTSATICTVLIQPDSALITKLNDYKDVNNSGFRDTEAVNYILGFTNIIEKYDLTNADTEVRDKVANVYNGLGLKYSQVEHNDKAIESYKTALTYCPNSLSILSNLGTSYRRVNNYEEAIKIYNTLIAKSKKSWRKKRAMRLLKDCEIKLKNN